MSKTVAQALVSIQSPSLLQGVRAVLAEEGVPHTEMGGDSDNGLLLCSIVDEPSVACPADLPIIRFWRSPRSVPSRQRKINPFDQKNVVAWVSTRPILDCDALRHSVRHLLSGRFVTLTNVLQRNAQILAAKETRSASGGLHLDRLRRFFEPLNIQEHVMESLEVALGELFTNAAYNAAVDSQGQYIHATTSRCTEVESEKPFAIRFGMDKVYAAVAVSDAYGSFRTARLIERMHHCFSPAGATYEDKQGGAGLGLFMVLQNASHLVINIKAGHFTKVIFLRRHAQTHREFARRSPSLTVCAVDGERARRHDRPPVCWRAALDRPDTPEATAWMLQPRGHFFVWTGQWIFFLQWEKRCG